MLTEEEKQVLRQAFQAGTLTDEQKREIIRRNQETPVQPVQQQNTTFDSRQKEGFETAVRPAFEAVGGTVGAVTGFSAPPLVTGGTASPLAPAAGLVGGALGTGLGSFAFDGVEELLEFAGVFPEDATMLENSKAFEAMTNDLLFAGGFQAGGALLKTGKPLLGKVFGVAKQEVTDLVQIAKNNGIHLGVIDTASGITGRIVRGAGHVLGIFPFIGGPVRREAIKRGDEVVTATNRVLNRFAPTAVMGDELGIDMSKAAKNSINEFRNTSARLYDNFRKVASNLSVKNVIRTGKIKGVAGKFVRQREAGKIILEDGTELKGSIADDLGNFIDDLTKLPKRISIEQYQQLGDDLEGFISKAINEGFDVKRVVSIKKAMELAKSQIDYHLLPHGQAKQLRESLHAADNFFSKGIVKFQTTTAKKAGRADRNIFRAGPVEPGSLNEDEIADVLVNLKSPKAIRDLKALVGDNLVKKATRRHIERIWDDSIIFDEENVIKGIDWDKFKKTLGLVGKKSDQRQALKTMLKSSDVSIEELEGLINVASRIQVPRSVNQFIARRAALGGLGSAAAGASATMIVPDSLLKSTGVAFLLRYGADIISNPQQLKAMRRIIDASGPVLQRRALFGRLIESLNQTLVSRGADRSELIPPIEAPAPSGVTEE